MNANRIINRMINQFMRRMMRSGVNAGVDAWAKQQNGKNPEGSEQKGQAPLNTRKAQQRMRKSMRLARRVGRF